MRKLAYIIKFDYSAVCVSVAFMKLIGLISAAALSASAFAQTYDDIFDGSVDDSWNTAGNWSAGLPSASDSVYINYSSGNSGLVRLENDVSVGELTFYHNPASWGSSGFSGDFALNASSMNITGKAGFFKFGGTLNISGNISTLAIINARYIRAGSISFGSGGNVGVEYSGTGTAEKQNLVVSGLVSFNGGGNVVLTGSSGDYYTTFGGMTGNSGNLQVKNNSTAANAYLTLNVAAGNSYSFGGEVSNKHDYWGSADVENKTINISKIGAGAQYFTNSNRVEITSATVSEGVFGMRGTIDGRLALDGGLFAVGSGGVSAGSVEWVSGGFVFDSAVLAGGDKISIGGAFEKSGGGKILIDFAGLDALAEGLIGTSSELISAAVVDEAAFDKSDANSDFSAVNLKNAAVDFSWNGNSLVATFAVVPEPAAVAAVLGALALGVAAFRGRMRGEP